MALVSHLNFLKEGANRKFRFTWGLLWLSEPVCLLMLFSLPETPAANIPLRRARRLRIFTGKDNLKSQSDIDQENMISSTVALDALITPWQINLLDLAVERPCPSSNQLRMLMIDLVGIHNRLHSPHIWHLLFLLRITSSSRHRYVQLQPRGIQLPFLSVLVALGVCMPAYCGYCYYIVESRVKMQSFWAS